MARKTIVVRAVFYVPKKSSYPAAALKKSSYPAAALKKGIAVEMEHTPDKHVAEFIAKHHIDEDENYYDKLETLKL